jgi:hypothetical protein
VGKKGIFGGTVIRKKNFHSVIFTAPGFEFVKETQFNADSMPSGTLIPACEKNDDEFVTHL